MKVEEGEVPGVMNWLRGEVENDSCAAEAREVFEL